MRRHSPRALWFPPCSHSTCTCISRFSGQIFSDQACSFTCYLPDQGYYTPQRIYDSNIGVMSVELYEDMLLYGDRKSEFVATLVAACKKVKNKVGVVFVDSVRLQGGGVKDMSLTPSKADVSFVSGNVERGYGFGGRFDAGMKFDKGSQRYVISVPRNAGVERDVMEDREKRIKKRQRKLDKRRTREREARAVVVAEREEARERERKERVEEKKRKKAREKEGREMGGEGGEERGEEKIKSVIRRSSAGAGGAGGGAGGGGEGNAQLTELQKAMAARRKKNDGN